MQYHRKTHGNIFLERWDEREDFDGRQFLLRVGKQRSEGGLFWIQCSHWDIVLQYAFMIALKPFTMAAGGNLGSRGP